MDYDNDGINDLLIGGFSGAVNLVKGLGGGNFAAKVYLKDQNGNIVGKKKRMSKAEKEKEINSQASLIEKRETTKVLN